MLNAVVKQVLPALRMLASGDSVLTLRLDDREVFTKIQDEEDLKELPFIQNDASVLVVDETTDPAEILSDLEVKLSMWKEGRTNYPDYVLIKEIGLVALAANAAKLNEMLGTGEGPCSEPVGRLANKIAIVTGAAIIFSTETASETSTFTNKARLQVASLFRRSAILAPSASFQSAITTLAPS